MTQLVTLVTMVVLDGGAANAPLDVPQVVVSISRRRKPGILAHLAVGGGGGGDS